MVCVCVCVKEAWGRQLNSYFACDGENVWYWGDGRWIVCVCVMLGVYVCDVCVCVCARAKELPRHSFHVASGWVTVCCVAVCC